MKRFLLMALLAGSPAFANDRAEGEARLAALSAQVVVALQTIELRPEGMECVSTVGPESPMYLTVLPSARLICRWDEAGEGKEAQVGLILSPAASAQLQSEITETQKALEADRLTADRVRVYGLPVARAMRTELLVTAAPSPLIAGFAESGGRRAFGAVDGMDDLAETLGGLDVAAVEGLPVVAKYQAALADHRALLTAQRQDLALMFPPTVNEIDPARMMSGGLGADTEFFGSQPLVQADVRQGGVMMLVTLTTSTFALEAAAEEGRFTEGAVNGDVSRGGVYHDRGRVKVYLGEKALTALIDGRGMLMLDVAEVEDGADPLAAMEAVLAGIAAHDFSDF